MRIFTYLLAFCVAAPVFAQDTPPAPPTIIITPPDVAAPAAPTNGDYEEVYKNLEEMTKNVFSEEKWKDVSFRHRVTKKEKKWSDFTGFEKKIFCLMMTDQLYERLAYIDEAWNWELNRFKNPFYKPTIVKDEKDASKNTATKEDVEKWLGKLTDLRKQFAVSIEKEMLATFKEYNEQIPEADQKQYLEKIQKRHDKDKLIERTQPEKDKDAKVPTDG